MTREAPATIPARIAALLRAVCILAGYGRHLTDTLAHRAAAPGFAALAACFGTADLSVIRARLQRGILRAVALERVLLARAARGRDISFAPPRIRTSNTSPTAAAASQQAAQRTAAPRPVRRRNDPADLHTPTLAELEAQVRRRPLGRTIVDICLDLAVVPGVCTGTFWNELFDAMQCYGGSIATMMRERCCREQAFHREQDSHPMQGRDRSGLRREMVRQVLGFFIGEEPALRFSPPVPVTPAAAVATGPP